MPAMGTAATPTNAKANAGLFELGAAPTVNRLSPAELAIHKPVALLALVPRAAVLFSAGAVSGAIAKTITAPLDRVKILLQVGVACVWQCVCQKPREGSNRQSRMPGLLLAPLPLRCRHQRHPPHEHRPAPLASHHCSSRAACTAAPSLRHPARATCCRR